MVIEDTVPEGQDEGSGTAGDQEPKRCRGSNADGTVCQAPPFWVGESGYCRAHDPARAGERRHSTALGGIRSAARRRKGIDIGKLETPSDAMRITARIATAVASGELSSAQGRAVLVAVAEWRKARDADEVAGRLQALERQVKAGRLRVSQ
jgi:hypothetical protein